MTDSVLSKLTMPAATIVAAAAGAAVWLLPAPFLEPRSITGVDQGAPPFPPVQKTPVDFRAQVPKPQTKDWSALVAQLDGLWDKPAVVASPTETTPTPPPAAVVQPLDWTYIAYAGTARFPAAFVIMTSNGERVLYVGDSVPDDFDPQGGRIVVTQITPQELVVTRQNQEQRFQLLQRDPSQIKPERPAGFPPHTSMAPVPMNSPMPGVSPAPDTPGARAR